MGVSAETSSGMMAAVMESDRKDQTGDDPPVPGKAQRRNPAARTPSTPAERLTRVRRYRVRPDRDISLSFLSDQFKRQIQKPYRQLGGVAAVWETLVPEDLAAHTRLESLARGILTVAVDSSARLYSLDAMLRQGLAPRLIEACRGASIRQIRLRQGSFA